MPLNSIYLKMVKTVNFMYVYLMANKVALYLGKKWGCPALMKDTEVYCKSTVEASPWEQRLSRYHVILSFDSSALISTVSYMYFVQHWFSFSKHLLSSWCCQSIILGVWSEQKGELPHRLGHPAKIPPRSHYKVNCGRCFLGGTKYALENTGRECLEVKY